MRVLKRNGNYENMAFDKVTVRIARLNQEPFTILNVAPDKVTQKVIDSLYDGIPTSEIDTLTAEVAIGLVTEDPDYETLATRIVVSNLQKMCPLQFSNAMIALHSKGIVSNDFMKCMGTKYDCLIQHDRDYLFGYFGIKTLQKGYLNVGETPQYMLMRVAIGIHGDDYEAVRETYEYTSQKFFTHASPTLFNAGTNRQQFSSCFLVSSKGDSMDKIYDTIKECALISKWSGGIGLHVSDIRAAGSVIRGTNGRSDGIVPMLRVYNNTARYSNQGGGKRKGSFAIYLEPWHADIMEFLELRLNQGDEEMRCRDLFTAMWMCDLFMKHVEADGEWWLMCPDQSPGLQDVYGDAFEELYYKYVAENKFVRVVKARDVWNAILKSQVETGTPYMLYKDACNQKSNQKNIGVIKSSNLCTEILEVSTPEETAVCTLASISLPSFIRHGHFDYDQLGRVTEVLVRNLNKIIDKNYYPVETARKSNMNHRPIGIGIQGLADVFMMLSLPFDSPEARELNKHIFENIYYHSNLESCRLAEIHGPYSTFAKSPASEGKFQFDLWGVSKNDAHWEELRKNVMKHGLRNSLLVAPMPTASTSQILGNNEAFEPYTTNIYLRRTLAGEFVMVNKHLVKDLQFFDMWNKKTKMEIIRQGGSVQALEGLPQKFKDIYRTAWEIPAKSIIDMAADRAIYICQSQSLNIWMENPTQARLSSMHFYGWKKGLKTGMYYLRTRSKAKPQQVTVTPLTQEQCSIENKDACMMCSG